MVKDALRIAELEKLLAEKTSELIQQGEELSVINSVQEALVKEMDMQAIYDLVGNKIQELFDAQTVMISTFDLESGTEHFQYMIENGERFYPEPRPLGKLRLHLIETGKKIIINNREEGEAWFEKEVIPGTEPIKSAVFVPLITGNKITSYVTLQNIDKENAFSESEIRLLETLANSMSTALENARLLKETEQRTAELAVINSVQEGLAKELDIQAIYDLVGNRIRELFDAQVVGIATFDHEHQTENIHYLIEKGERYYPVPRPMNTLRKHLIQTKEKVLINKNFESVALAFGVKKVPGTEQPKSALYVPLVIGDKVTGNISIQNIDRENAISDSDVRLMETLANSMGVALENARLFDETTRLLKETEQQKAELGVINSVQEGLAKELDMQAIYDLVGNRIQELFNAQAVMIVTFDHDTATEHFKYLIEDGQRFYLASRPYDKLRQHLIVTRQKIVINTNYEEAYAKFGLKTLPGTNPTKSSVFVPLIIGDKVNSYISLQNMQIENAFSDSDVRLLETLANSMSVALENARLFDETTRLLKETEQRTAELAVINSVQEGLARELDMKAIYDLVGNKIRDVFDAQAVVIATFEHETGTEKFNYMIEKGERFYAEPRRYDKLRYQLIMTKQKILINNNSEEAFKEFGLKVVLGTEMPKSLLYVPLIVGNKVTSYVSLQNVDKENAFSDSDVRLLETLANSMSVALENARLFDETTRLLKETEQRTAELAIINSVQEGLASKLDIQSIYDLVGDKIRDVFNAQGITISFLDRQKNYITHPYYLYKGERIIEEGFEFGKGLTSLVIQTGQPLLINENAINRFRELGVVYAAEESEEDTCKSWLAVPLISGGLVNGTIKLENYEKEFAYSESDVSLLQTLANSISVALENARLFDETNRLLKETEQRTAELAVINSVQEGLAKELDMQAIYELVGNKIQQVFNAQAVIIASFDHEKKSEHFNYHIEKGEISYPQARPYDKLRQHLIETRERILINNHNEETAAQFGMKVIPGTEMPKSLLFVPLISGDKVKSYVSLQNIDQENAFSESDVRLLETLANSMSVAIENARLFDETNRLLKETEQRTAELAVINSVQEGLAKELDMNGIYNMVGDRLCELFPDTQTLVIRTFDHEKELEHFHYAIEKGVYLEINPRPFIWESKQLIFTKKPLDIESNYEEISIQNGESAVTEGEPVKSAVFVPMMVGEQVRGSISLQNVDKENAFIESDIRLLTTLTNSMSVALENARLFDETNRLLKETEQRTAELSVINSVQEGLAKELDIQGIYELVGEKIREIFNAQVIDIVSYDKNNDLVEDRYAFEKGDRTLIGSWKPVGFGKYVIETGQLIVINEDLVNKAIEYNSKVMHGEAPKSAVWVPLISGNDVKGVISLQDLDKEQAFTDADVNLLTTLANSMSMALESARRFDETNRLLKETEQRTAELAVINSVQEGLAKELDMQGIYNMVGDRLCELFPDSQTLVIRTFNHENGLEHWHYAKEKGIRQYVEPRALNWNSQQLINTKKPLDIKENYVEISKQHGGTGVTTGQPPKSAVFVPMLVGDVVKGSISLQNVDKENAFTDSDTRLLTTITNSMSVALENARLFEETNRLLKETEQRTGELAVINSVQEGLVREMDMQGIYETVGERLCSLFNIQTVVIRTFDHATGLEHWQYAKEKGERQYVEPRPFNWNSNRLIETKKPLDIKENYLEESKKYGGKGVTAGQPPKSAVFVPMIVGDVVKGSVSLQNVDKENAFSESDIRLLTTLTNSMSVALENARLFDETTHLLADAKQRATELSTVNSISRALASQLNPDELIKLVGDQLKDLFNANIVYLALLNKKTNIIHFPYQHGDNMEPLKMGDGLTSSIILKGEPLLINKDLQELRTQMGIAQIGVPAASYLGVPIPVGDENIGVLSVQSTEHENRFDENDLRLLSTIASSVGVALRNAQLFEDVKLAKMEAEVASKLAGKANEAKSAFLSTVSHELRTPLTSVLGFAKIIQKRLNEKIFPIVDRADAKTEKTIHQISENLHVVISEGERLTHLINDVLDLAKIEAGKMEWNQENVSMAEVAERAIAATTSLFDQKLLTLNKVIDFQLPQITGDKDKLIQVMINLISNAVKFTDKGSISCRVYQQKEELIVSISDTGIGIAPEDFAAVFEQFKQVGGDTLTDKPKGTGLGLPICKEIVEHHGGRIWLESERDKGSTFSFALPINKTTETRPIHLDDLVRQLKEQVAHSQLNVKGQAAHILIVDDDDSIRSLLHQELGDAGYNIEEASNGKEALACVRKQRPDLIILDIMMPEMNGFDVAAVLKNDPQTMDIPIIVLSIVQDKARGFRIGVDRYLTKPIDTNLLFAEIGSLLEQGKSKKKVMVVDEDSATVNTLIEVLTTKGYDVMESNEKELMQKAVAHQPDIIIINGVLSGNQDIVRTLRFENGLENVLFMVYQ